MRFAAALALLSLATPVAGEIRFRPPLDCAPGAGCYVQNYVDRDPGPGARDFTCGALTYDGHKGTDFALPDDAAMLAGVPVRAAAAGTVTGIRNSMPDIRFSDPAAPPLDGKDCGNGVVLDHGDGWETQYCHMKQGSVSVSLGQEVQAGAQLGLVGLSGRTEFPHVHISIRRNGEHLDPFAPAMAQCSATPPADTLWADPLAYRAGGLISAGFATQVPEYAAIKAGTAAATSIPAGAPALVLWGHAFGTRPGDMLELTITAPDGSLFHEGTATFDRAQAQAFRASGRRASGLQAGTWRGALRLMRGGEVIDSRTLSLRVTP
ncbi:Murein DD-endopeptidase MepM [Pseudoruegeria aquimaris]|uniref:Murein DD-endopeptidase MepM n=1 Tax=Pseudoruegeria aquimaris TaxID=393663 RepID=A0A1Y5T6P3_9RHOB|nr:M23 family metallopeptidase [Pseudoruegeria aquimaris]SLN57150.1 Murein DD-endopeptidase MepM [Pseudoruegeria aquimaris]